MAMENMFQLVMEVFQYQADGEYWKRATIQNGSSYN